MWDLTAAGSALQGESSWQAAEREVAEEIGLKIDLSNKRPIFSINFIFFVICTPYVYYTIYLNFFYGFFNFMLKG